MAKTLYEINVQPNFTRIEGWVRDGLTNEQIAINLGIGKTTLFKYLDKYPEFRELLKRGKEVVDREVENALLKRALGYEYEEVTQELINGKMKETKRVKKNVAPDTTAQIFWLKNRKPKEWRDRKNLELEGGVEVKNPFQELSKEELIRLANLDKK